VRAWASERLTTSQGMHAHAPHHLKPVAIQQLVLAVGLAPIPLSRDLAWARCVTCVTCARAWHAAGPFQCSHAPPPQISVATEDASAQRCTFFTFAPFTKFSARCRRAISSNSSSLRACSRGNVEAHRRDRGADRAVKPHRNLRMASPSPWFT
jgi:hypothetical protein